MNSSLESSCRLLPGGSNGPGQFHPQLYKCCRNSLMTCAWTSCPDRSWLTNIRSQVCSRCECSSDSSLTSSFRESFTASLLPSLSVSLSVSRLTLRSPSKAERRANMAKSRASKDVNDNKSDQPTMVPSSCRPRRPNSVCVKHSSLRSLPM